MLYNQQYSLSPVAAPLFNSFECLVLTIFESLSTAIVTVYPNEVIVYLLRLLI